MQPADDEIFSTSPTIERLCKWIQLLIMEKQGEMMHYRATDFKAQNEVEQLRRIRQQLIDAFKQAVPNWKNLREAAKDKHSDTI